MLNYSLRCYNRFSFFIGAVGIIISMKLLQESCFWFTDKLKNKQLKAIISCIFSAFVLAIGVFDQTTASMIYTKDYGENIQMQYRNDESFVYNIEQFEGDNANILVFPVMNAQQSAISNTKDNINTSYNDQMLFIHANTSNWSAGGSKAGEKGERWLNWLESFDEKTQIEIAAVVGFSGIAIYYGGYEAEKLNSILIDLNNLLGTPIAVNDSGTWAYYSISRVRDELLSDYTETELLELKNKYLFNYNSWHQYNYSNLATTSAYQESDKLITLTKDTCQYGSYNSFDAGKYTVEIYGENLNYATFDCFANGNMFDIHIEESNENYIKYHVFLESITDAVEFRTFNTTDNKIVVEKIEVTKMTN